jgi:hypothetical protein
MTPKTPGYASDREKSTGSCLAACLIGGAIVGAVFPPLFLIGGSAVYDSIESDNIFFVLSYPVKIVLEWLGNANVVARQSGAVVLIALCVYWACVGTVAGSVLHLIFPRRSNKRQKPRYQRLRR